MGVTDDFDKSAFSEVVKASLDEIKNKMGKIKNFRYRPLNTSFSLN